MPTFNNNKFVIIYKIY